MEIISPYRIADNNAVSLKISIHRQEGRVSYSQYIRWLFVDGDKLGIETINREFLASVHLSSGIESSNGQKKIYGGEEGIDSDASMGGRQEGGPGVGCALCTLDKLLRLESRVEGALIKQLISGHTSAPVACRLLADIRAWREPAANLLG